MKNDKIRDMYQNETHLRGKSDEENADLL